MYRTPTTRPHQPARHTTLHTAILAVVLALGLAGPWTMPQAQAQPVYTCFGVTATIVGTSGDDVIYATPADDVIVGPRGNDIIAGFGGDESHLWRCRQ